jgi:hypothetical protein
MKYFGSSPTRLGVPGMLLTPLSPWQPAHAAAAPLPACTGSDFAGAAFAAGAVGRGGSRLA